MAARKKSVRKKAVPRKRAVQVARGVKLARGKESQLRKKPGASSTGKYKNVPTGEFCGAAGGTSKYSFPVNSLKRARNALARAHYAPNPEGIRKCVKRKWGGKIATLSKKSKRSKK